LRPTPPAPKVPSAEGRVMPPSPIPPAKGFAYRTPDEAALSVIEKNKGSGLQFPDDESFARLHKKIRREDSAAAGKKAAGQPLNDRMVIKAPEDSGLPDFVTGKINYGDWIARHENILNDDEIHHAADWYNRIYDEFKQYYPDEEESKKNMRAWLVAQQNVSPAGAMQNVLLQKEQMKRGVPKELWRAGGMPNPTEAARDVLQSQPIGGGVGQKIADFVDSAEGKSVRSWMANHPDGGEPFVVDVHTARDTGIVDQELLNHLDRLGYDKEALKKVQIDLTGTPSEPAYENRAAWGRGLTDHLNEIGWKGRNDWTPAEVQAVGWMGMTKLTRNAEEDVQSGLAKNLRRIAYEAEPINGSPWHKKYSKQLNALSPEDKLEVTSRLTESALKHASDLSGIDVHSLIHGSSAGKNQSAVAQSLATKGGADIAANALGYLLNQGEVWHNRVKPMTSAPKGYAIDFVQSSGKDLEDSGKIKDLWNKITKADDSGLFQGFHPIKLPSGEVGIRALVDKGGDKTREKIESALAENSPIQKAIADFGLDIDMLGYEAEISKATNNWTEKKNGESYLERLADLIGKDRAASLNSVRQKLEGELDSHLEEIGQRQTEPSEGSRKKVKKAFGGEVDGDDGISAYHGSPYEFDEFDTGKIGTGEGAQAYGHGLYFAENPEVAQAYRSRLAGRPEIKGLTLAGHTVGPHNGFDYGPKTNSTYENLRSSLFEDLLINEDALLADPSNVKNLAINTLKERMKDLPDEWPEAVPHAEKLLKDINRANGAKLKLGETPGKMYEVRLNMGPEHLLNWDKPLSEQHPEVQKALSKHPLSNRLFGNDVVKGELTEPTGESILNRLIGKPHERSEQLLNMGIRGIRYLDAGSRGQDGHTGSHNIVVFDPQHIKIKRKYAKGGEILNRDDEGIVAYAFGNSIPHLDKIHDEIPEALPQKAYGGSIPGPKLTEENADDFARRLIAWTFATAPLFHRAAGGSVIDDPLDVLSKLRR